jgi:hypothetical protein
MLGVTDRRTDEHMPVNTASFKGPDILVIFLRKDYQYKLSSHASENSLPLRP